MKQRLAEVYAYIKRRRRQKIIGIVLGSMLAIVLAAIGIGVFIKLKGTETSMPQLMFFGILLLITFITVAAKNGFDLIDINGCEQILNKIIKKMSVGEMFEIDLTNFFPDCENDLYNKLLIAYADGKKLKVRLEMTDFYDRMNLRLLPEGEEKNSFSVWFKVDDFKKVDKIYRFIQEYAG